jgi:hypothetical protein
MKGAADASDRLARSSRGTFCKSKRNHRQEQVGEDFVGNRPDELSGFIGLHWTARPIERASVKNNTPNSLQRDAVSRLQPQVARPSQRRQPTSTTSRPLPLQPTADQ